MSARFMMLYFTFAVLVASVRADLAHSKGDESAALRWEAELLSSEVTEGEPIMVWGSLRNTGGRPIVVVAPEFFGSIAVDVTSPRGAQLDCHPENACGGSSVVAGVILSPGEQVITSARLATSCAFERPGTYVIELTWASLSPSVSVDGVLVATTWDGRLTASLKVQVHSASEQADMAGLRLLKRADGRLDSGVLYKVLTEAPDSRAADWARYELGWQSALLRPPVDTRSVEAVLPPEPYRALARLELAAEMRRQGRLAEAARQEDLARAAPGLLQSERLLGAGDR